MSSRAQNAAQMPRLHAALVRAALARLDVAVLVTFPAPSPHWLPVFAS